MDKISHAQISQAMKTAASSLRTISVENAELKEKVAHYERKERAEVLANQMDDKGLQPELSFQEKVAGLLKRDNLDAVEEAINMSAPQTKLASVHEEGRVTVEGASELEGGAAQDNFAAALAGLE